MAELAEIVDIKPLFSGDATSRKTAVQALGNAIEKDGAFVAAGLPDGWHRQRRAAALLAFFGLSEADKLSLATRRVRADSPRNYRGYVSTLTDGWAYNEFFDSGPERALAKPALAAAQIFTETNVWPAWPPFPNWRAEMLAYHGAMEKTGGAILSAAGQYLALPEGKLAALFANAGATLRLLNYPRKPDGAAIKEEMPLAARRAARSDIFMNPISTPIYLPSSCRCPPTHKAPPD